MWNILLFFAIGMIIGWFARNRTQLRNAAGWITNILLGMLIFMLGVSAGNQPEVTENFSQLGLTAIMIALGAIIGSILFVLPISRKLSDIE
jgi:uncharacterized membrane protein YeaQ/YmgE (transglycosylase-associated protein family)